MSDAPAVPVFEFVLDAVKQGDELVDVAFVRIWPAGDPRSTVFRRAEGWLEQVQKQAGAGLVPEDWARKVQEHYKQWRAGHESSMPGTPLRAWAAITPAALAGFLAQSVFTVEQLAGLSESVLSGMPLGSRSWAEKAKLYLTEKTGPGRLVEQMSNLQAVLGTQADEIAALKAQLAAAARAPAK